VPFAFSCRGADKKRLGDVAVLDLDSFTWRRPAVSGNAPRPRELASAVYHAGHMIVFGGVLPRAGACPQPVRLQKSGCLSAVTIDIKAVCVNGSTGA